MRFNALQKYLFGGLVFLYSSVAPSHAQVPDTSETAMKALAHLRCAALSQLIIGKEWKGKSDGFLSNAIDSFRRASSDVVARPEHTGFPTNVGINYLDYWLNLGPSVDFRIGYLWSRYQDIAHHETWDRTVKSSELFLTQSDNAFQKFKTENCPFLAQD